MTLQSLSRLPTVLSLVAVGTVGAALAQPAFEPRVGQDGKDVVWVPTAQTLVDKMLDMAQLTPRDRLVDLGSGDGRLVITAAKRGATARGIEYNPDMVELARSQARAEGVSDRVPHRPRARVAGARSVEGDGHDEARPLHLDELVSHAVSTSLGESGWIRSADGGKYHI